MSKENFKNINNSIEYYKTRVLIPDNIYLNMFPHIKEITENKIEILNKLLELVGDKEDKYYDAFFNKKIKDYIFKQFYGGLKNINKFNDINDFINKIKNYEWNDGKLFMNEIKSLLDKCEETKENIKPKKKKKTISATMKRLVWNNWIGEEIGKSKCLCCKTTDIIQSSFNCGHIIPESKGGETIVSNLKPICQNCNSSMGAIDMNEFMKTLF